MNRRYQPHYRAAFFLLVLTVMGCEEDVTAPSGVDEPFSMYGVINPRLETQTLLVSPIEPLLYDYPEMIDALVASTDLATGETIVWEDSVVRGERGQLDHVFHANFQARFAGEYSIEVARSDGTVSSAEVRVPDKVEITWNDRLERFMDIHISGESFHVINADVIYTVRWNPLNPENTPCSFTADSYAVSYTDDIVKKDGSYRIRVDLVADHDRVFADYSRDHGRLLDYQRAAGLALMGLEVRILVAEPSWTPSTSTLEGTDVSFPGVESNVTNGYGFVASGYDEYRRLYPAADVVETSSFRDYLMRPPSDCVDYCSCDSR